MALDAAKSWCNEEVSFPMEEVMAGASTSAGSPLLALAHRGIPSVGAAGPAIHGLPDAEAKANSTHMTTASPRR